MSHTRVKTTFETMGNYGSTDTVEMFCHHNHSCDITTFFYKDGSVVDMCFEDWSSGKDKWDAVQKLWSPFKDEWNGDLLDGVEYYSTSEFDEFKQPLTN